MKKEYDHAIDAEATIGGIRRGGKLVEDNGATVVFAYHSHGYHEEILPRKSVMVLCKNWPDNGNYCMFQRPKVFAGEQYEMCPCSNKN